jgi:hypothetical protein
MKLLRKKLTYANVVATLALIVAVAGIPTAIAVTVRATKTSDVNKKGNIRAGHVTAPKIADGNVTAGKLAAVDIVSRSGGGFTPVPCPAGERILSGGYVANSGADVPISRPEGNGWAATFSPAGQTGITYAVCLKG